jgi:hypothetical protein
MVGGAAVSGSQRRVAVNLPVGIPEDPLGPGYWQLDEGPRGWRGAADARGAATMEPISLILAALLAGVVTGAGQSASSAVQDAYAGLRDALKRRLAARPAAQDAVEQFTRDPDAWKGNLEVHLQQAGAGQDQAILAAAASVLRQVDPEGASKGKYVVDLRGAAGVQVGDGSTQTNYFGSPPR